MSTNIRWVTATVLRELGLRAQRPGAKFTASELAAWTEGTLSHEQRVHASSRLCALKFVLHSVARVEGKQDDIYTVTEDGWAAMQAAVGGHVRKSGPKGTRKPNPIKPESLAARLWSLVRLRKIVEVDSAAQTLCDAGEDDYQRVHETVARTLRRWELCGALQGGAKRVRRDVARSNGTKRYVLVVDSLEPPRWRPALKAQREALMAGAQA